jgi:proteasome lid subunit RPN8/RPN11
MAVLHLSESIRADLEALACKGYPLEVCGLLVGRQNNGRTEVEKVTQAKNLNRERARDRFELDPMHLLDMDESARTHGLQIVGVWHTHPDHPARPSDTDLEFAWKGWSYVIASVSRDGVKDVRSWRLGDSEFIEEIIEP